MTRVKLFLLASAGMIPFGALAQVATVNSPASKEGADSLDEIVVTAEKREERLQDVPVPVSVINTQTLAQTGEVRLQEYYSTVPGLIVTTSGTTGNQQNIVIRGISTGGSTNTTVGITVDDVPFGSNYSYAGNITPDLDPSDLARVEVLRGPQGTLYGAASMGGLVKFVTVDPSTAGLSGHVEADVNTVYNGAEPGYGFRGAVNVPLTDDLAIRASGFTRQDAGYIDNPVQHKTGVNEAEDSGGRVSALWSPSDLFRLKVSALYQHSKADSISEVDLLPGFGDLQQNANIGCCTLDRTLQAYSATITSKLGIVDLTSVTGYNVSDFRNSLDYSYLLGAVAQSAFGVNSVRYEMHGVTDKFTQEVRASIPIGQTFEWLVGAFYQHETTNYDVAIPAVTPATGAPVGSIANIILPYDFSEYAGFTDLTVHFTDKFNIQIGGRESFINQESETDLEQGPLFGTTSTILVPPVKTTPNVFTFQVTPQYKISPDDMLYARIATGYRQGVTNVPVPGLTYPKASTPDRTTNYELGAKGNLFTPMLSYDVSLYYIDWKDIQLTVKSSPTIAYSTNGSRAKSEGLELALEAKPLDGLTIRGWYSNDDAVLTQPVPAAATIYGPAGSRLPLSARNTYNLSVNQTFPLASEIAGYVGAELSYVGERLGIFEPTPPRAVFPAYTKADLRVGATYRDWAATLYANNVADRRGVVGGGLGNYPPYGYYYIQPRTIGLSLDKSF